MSLPNTGSTSLILLLIIVLSVTECRRISGGGRKPSHQSFPSNHPSQSQPSSYHSAPSQLSPSHPSPSYRQPLSHPASLPSQSQPLLTVYRPPGYPGSGIGTVRPIGWQPQGNQGSGPIGPPKSNNPLGSNAGSANVRSIGFQPPSALPAGQLVGLPKNIGHLGSSQGTNYAQSPPAYNPSFNPAGYGQPPAYNTAVHGQSPAYHSAGYGPAGYGHAPPAYQSGGGGVTIINNNNNNHHYSSFSPPSYQYTTHDTGSGSLGLFLGYTLGRLNTPSYHNYYSTGNSYSPIYDHYEVHHYYHNSQNVPKQAEIQPNAVIACVGDSGSFCPANTISLCTNNGAVMCVVSTVSTVPCLDDKQINCVQSTVPCLNNSAPECKQPSQNFTTINLPCISTATIYANITYVNNTVLIANNPGSTNAMVNPATNSTNLGSDTTTVSRIIETTTPNMITTTPNSVNASIAANDTDTKKSPPQTFCVTILALPAENEIKQGEKLFGISNKIFGEFAVKALGVI